MLTKQEKEQIIKEFGGSEKNTGLTEVQVALLTKDIAKMTEHLKEHKKDNHSKRGLQLKIGKRNSLVKYLKNSDTPRYNALVEKLNLRRR